jgi:AraC-like DNA-binding protein
VPLRKGEHLLGFVRTGQVFRRTPTHAGFARVLKRLTRWGVKFDAVKLRKAYFATPVIARARYQASLVLLTFLARHLALVSNQVYLQQALVKNPAIANAKEFIEANYSRRVTLSQVAGAVRMGRFSFCIKFRQATGVHFNRYVSHFRIEKAKQLLHNPHYRISEICYAVGFNSLTQFNRIFNRVTGLSPTVYRAGLGPPRDSRPSEERRFRAYVGSQPPISEVLRQTVENAKPRDDKN